MPELTIPLTLTLTKSDVARHLRLSVRQVERLDDAAQLPAAVNVGSRRRWWTHEIIAYLAGGYTTRRQFEAALGEKTPQPTEAAR